MEIESGLRGVAHALEDRIPEVAAAINERIGTEVPEYEVSGDPVLLDVAERVPFEALRDIFFGLGHGREPPERATGSAIEEARLAAQANIDLQVLLRTYRVAQAVTWEAIVEEVERRIEDADTRMAILRLASRYHFAWNDRMMAIVIGVYQSERDALLRSRERRKRQVVRDLLDGLPADSSEIAYNLRGHHLGVVAWGQAADQAILKLARSLEGRALTIQGTGDTILGWIGGDGVAKPRGQMLAPFDVPAATYLAIGTPVFGREGFQLTHRQAWQAYRVARFKSQAVTLYSDVALESLLLQDVQSVRDFVQYSLGSMADDDERARVLRTTLLAYFSTGQNASSAAQLLGVHERTVAYRLRSVEKRLGISVARRRDELSIALRLIGVVGGALNAEAGKAGRRAAAGDDLLAAGSSEIVPPERL